jgi:hypothetical protein
MDDEVACRKSAYFCQKMIRAARLATRAKKPVAQDILFADERETRRFKSLLHANDGHRQRGSGERQGRPKRGHRRGVDEAMVGENMGQALTRAIRPRGKNHPLSACLQRLHVADSGAEDIGVRVSALGRKYAARP